MNTVQLMGRLCRDPEVRYSGKGKDAFAICNYTLAIDRGYGEDAKTDFIPCVVFGGGAEFAEKYFYKGLRIAVTGRLQSGSYENKNGDTVYTLDVYVNTQEFADSKRPDPSEDVADTGGGRRGKRK